MSGRVYKVDELSKVINSTISSLFHGSVAVVGEVQNTSRSPAGHLYFSLKDTNSSINVVMFKNYAQLSSVTVKAGDLVVVYGELNTYQASSTYQLRARRIVYERLGDFYKKFEAVKQLLESEGFFDSHRKKQLKPYPERVALITSPHGAAFGDFIKVAKAAGGVFEADLYGVPVQGAGAERLIAAGIANAVNRSRRLGYTYDAIVVMRGGGSQDDLSVFNSELIARAISAADATVISAIGHERDQTICDLVADVVASTPTDAATILCTGYTAAKGSIDDAQRVLVSRVNNGLENRWQYLDHMYGTLSKGVSPQQLNTHNTELEMLLTKVRTLMDYGFANAIGVHEKELITSIDVQITKQKQRLNTYAQMIKTLQPLPQNLNQPVDYLGVRIDRSLTNKLQLLQSKLTELGRSCSPNTLLIQCQNAQRETDEQTIKLARLMDDAKYSWQRGLSAALQRINTLNPELLLQKGYSIVYHKGSVVEGLDNIEHDTIINIQLKSGWINASVINLGDEREDNKPHVDIKNPNYP